MNNNYIIDDIIDEGKSLVIAPAGCGKTHMIAECVKSTTGKQLILTHTNAGVAAIKEKLTKLEVESIKYHVETIAGYAMKYVDSFSKDRNKLKDRNGLKLLYDWIYQEATNIFQQRHIQDIIRRTYSGLFVDEYQDCTETQHKMIMNIHSTDVPIHIFGDHLQGIFNFNGNALINLEDSNNQFKNFNKHELTTPYRWQNINEELGKDLGQIREDLKNKKDINLLNYKSIKYVSSESEVQKYINDKNVLIIHHNSKDIKPREEIAKNHPEYSILEAIDGKDFYECSNCIDTKIKEKKKTHQEIIDILEKKQHVRKELIDDLCEATNLSKENHISVYEAMISIRDRKRKGKKIEGKCIGTTLLTKGLECDTVIIWYLNAGNFKFTPQNLYVAMTRASKNLVVLAEKNILPIA